MGGGAVGQVSGWRELTKRENRRALWFCLVIASAPLLFGYDSVYFASILQIPKFHYGSLQADGTVTYSSSDESLWTSIIVSQLGEVVGSIIAGFVGDRFGRKGALWCTVFFVIVGVIVALSDAASATLTVGRLIIGIGVGIASNAVPLYLAELPPVQIRGTCVAFWQWWLAVGQVIGAVIGLACKNLTSSGAYRIPIGLNASFALFIAAGLFYLPESPRWLLYKNRDDDVVRVLNRVHGGSWRADEERDVVVAQELAIMRQTRDAELHDQRLNGTGGWMELITDPIERRKTIIAVGALVCNQISGVQFIFSYTTTFFELVGLDDPFTITIIVDCVEVLGVFCSFFIVDRFGRKTILLSVGTFMMLCLLAVGAMGAAAGRYTFSDYFAAHKPVGNAITAMIMLYVFTYNFSWGPVAWAVVSENASGRNRQKIMAVATVGFWVTSWAVTFTLPYLFNADEAGLGPMIGFIYGGIAFLTLVFTYFVIPETRGKTLDEINLMFDQGVPTREWKRYQVGAMGVPGGAEPALVVSRADDEATITGDSEKQQKRVPAETRHFE